MRKLLPGLSVLALVLVAAAAYARDREKVSVRTLLLSEHPDKAAHRIYVKGQVVTVLRFEQPCDAARTKILGGEGRFEPVGVVGKKVVLEPLRDLDDDEGVPLLVTLADGTEVPFLLRPPSREDWGWTDQQVNVFKDRESYEAMFSLLTDTLRAKQSLEEEVERYRQEETSEDHALAALLVSGAAKQTPFKVARRITGEDADSAVEMVLYRGQGKAAVMFKVKNLDPKQSWLTTRARLLSVSSGRDRAFAIRTTAPFIRPGASGVFAMVVDKREFLEEGKLTSLFLEVYGHDGSREAFVQLDPYLTGE